MESAEAVRNIEAIAAVEGIDVAVMGTMDLSLDIGHPGQRTHPEIKKSVQRVVDVCQKQGCVSGTHVREVDELRYWMGQGMRMITYSSEVDMLIGKGSEAHRLFQATLEILESIGIHYQDPEAMEVFRKGGASVEDDIVYIPTWLVERALSTVPKHLVLYDQLGQPAIRLGGRCAYFGNGGDLPYIIDHRTGDRRDAILQDVYDMMRLLDSLENIDFVMSGFLPKNVPMDKLECLQMQAMLRYTNKPILYESTKVLPAQQAIAMAEVVAGGVEPLRLKPFAVGYINVANPLRHNPESVAKLIWLSRKGLPVIYTPSHVTRGISTPITAAGFLAVNSAAVLSGLVLSQLVREGTPFLGDSCAASTFEMRHMIGLLAAPEMRGFNEELLHYHRLPGFGDGGMTDAKQIDAQAGFETALTLITSVQAGAGLIHDVGYMDSGNLGSLAQMVICDEMIGWVKAYMKPLVVNDEALALDLIREVAAREGDFVGTEHTVRHFREDHYPSLINRMSYDSWVAAGSLSLLEKACAYVEHLLEAPAKSLLSSDQEETIQAIIDQ
jgi:trimethylamine--corrinoid protein Co-methyltransferase